MRNHISAVVEACYEDLVLCMSADLRSMFELHLPICINNVVFLNHS